MGSNWGALVARCFFCLEDRKLTRAHLFQKDFRDALKQLDNRVYLASASTSDMGVSRSLSYQGDCRATLVTSLCGGCNANWMQRIEAAAASTFRQLIERDLVPPPRELLCLAHWAVVVSALSSELHPRLSIPESQRRAIRASVGMPVGFSTYFIWTADYLPSIQMDLYRGFSEAPVGHETHWIHQLHVGAVTIISATPSLMGRVPRILRDSGVHSTLGFIGPTAVYVPETFHDAMAAARHPTHGEMHRLGPTILAGDKSFTTAPNGVQMLDLSGGVEMKMVDLSFDFNERLFDIVELGRNKP